MKQYPTILGEKGIRLGEPAYAFYKYDGSNLRWEWSKKNGFYKYGTRHRLFDASDSQFGDAVQLFHDTYAKDLEKVLLENYKDRKATVFTEYLGDNSFAGNHDATDKKRLHLIDVQVDKKGFLDPKEFIKLFQHLPFCADLVYHGNINKTFIADIREGKYPVIEGVIVKGGTGHKRWMAKIKTYAYLEKLKAVYQNNWQDFWE